MKWIDKKTFAIYYYFLFIFFMLIRYFDGLLLSQVSNNPIRSPRIDPIVWIFQNTGIPQFFSETSSISIYLDVLVILLPIIALFMIFMKRRIQYISILHVIVFAFYILLIYCFPTLSIRKYLGLLFIPIAFTFISESRYCTLMEWLRFYVLFVFSSAALWKITRGAIWSSDQMQLLLKSQHIDNVVNWPEHYLTKLSLYFIDHAQLASFLLIIGILLQLSFLIGFFTKKFDRILACFLLLFILSDYFVMRIEYWEFIVFFPLLWQKKSND